MHKRASTRLSDFSACLSDRGNQISRDSISSQWQLAPYECNEGSGTMLLARPWTSAGAAVRIMPNLSGWHRIRVCLFSDAHPSGGISLHLDGDLGGSFFVKGLPDSKFALWGMFEMAEEYEWKCADLTGKGITLEHLAGPGRSSIGLLWLDFEAMSQAEIASFQKDMAQNETRTLHDHTDLDWLAYLSRIDRNVFAPYLQDILQSDARVHSVEFYPTLTDYRFMDDVRSAHLESSIDPRLAVFEAFSGIHREAFTTLLEQGHAHGHFFYAALRIALSKCPPPFDCHPINHNAFADAHPEFYCVDRDGRTVPTLSYAYREVQDYAIEQFLRMTALGFDGVSLFFHRGVMTLFEEPVISAFQKRYPALDPRTLPLDDERLSQIHIEVLTEFIRRLRCALDKQSFAMHRPRLAINIMCNYSLADDKRYGIDINRWSEEKLIDSFVVENMRIWEDSSRYADSARPGLIDLSRYAQLNSHDTVAPVHRHFGNELSLKLQYIDEHLDISARHGVTAYFELPWEWSVSPVEFRNYAIKLYEAGAWNLSLWDCFSKRVMKRSEWKVVSRLGHREELLQSPEDHEDYGHSVRMLSLNGLNMSPYHPAWRG